MRARVTDAAGVALGKAVVSSLVWASGFRALSDDDYARIVIAQRFAESPSLDPTGTSWLPLPFWLNGGAMLLFGASVEVGPVNRAWIEIGRKSLDDSRERANA